MTPAQVELVKNSNRKLVPISDQVAVLFYARLFELDPSLRRLFRGDMLEQGRRLMSMVAITVAMLHRIEVLVPQIQDLGTMYARHGLREHQYATVAEAWFWSLEKGLGPEFDENTRAAWYTAFSLVTHVMTEAARAGQLPPPSPAASFVAA